MTDHPMKPEDRSLIEIRSVDRTHVPALQPRAENQRPKTNEHRDLKLYRYGDTDLHQWWSRKNGSVFEDPCDEPFVIIDAARQEGRCSPGEGVVHADDCQSHTVDTRGRPDDCTCGAEDAEKGNHDCLAKRRPSEPMFIFLGRDPDAHNLVRLWAERRLAAGGDPEHCQMGLDTAARMQAYAADPANRPASAPPADSYPPASSPPPSGEVRGKLLDTDDLADKATIDHPDTYLNALLTYTRDLYGALVKAGWKPKEIADCFQHIERAARGLHAKALPAARPPAGEVREAAAKILRREMENNSIPATERSLKAVDAILALITTRDEAALPEPREGNGDPHARIYVGNNKFALVDWADYNKVCGFRWRLSTDKGSARYAQAWQCADDGSRKLITMHSLLMEPPPGLFPDHINGDGLDNRRENLRLATKQQNAFNQAGHGGSSKFKGVSYRSDTQTWRADIRRNGIRKHLGTFASEIEAARAYNAAAKELYGEFAKLNPVELDEPSRLPAETEEGR